MSSLQFDLPDFDALWNYDRPAETEDAFLAVLRQMEDAAPPAYRLELLTQIARTQGLQRRFDDAHATLDRVEVGLDDLPAADAVTPRIRYLLERGRVFNSAGQPERARPLFVGAWESATASARDGYAVDAAHMLGIVEPGEAGLAWNRKALAFAEASAEPRARRWRGSLHNNMGWSYHDAGNYERALAEFESARAAWAADGEAELVPIARWAIARALRSLGRIEEALARQMSLLEEHERAGTSDGYVREEIGECLLALGRADEARPHFARAWSLLSRNPWLAETQPARLERLHTLGSVGTSE